LPALLGCGATGGVLLPDENDAPLPGEGFELVARFAHISDTHIVDEESPARLTPTYGIVSSAWRPQESYSLHLLDGTLRAVNLYHERIAALGFLLLTGDGIDNAQRNEIDWMLDVFDGEEVDPLSGVDDRPASAPRGGPDDQHAAFQPVGLYREGVQGPLADIPWYAVMGNHERFALGTFPIEARVDGGWFAPLPVPNRIGLFLPTMLIPDGAIAYGAITPAHPGPPPTVTFPQAVPARAERRYITPAEYVQAHYHTRTGPPGHGLPDSGKTWYTTSPAPGFRLIVLDTSFTPLAVPTGIYDSGGIVREQLAFLMDALDAAQAANEVVVVASHHASRYFTGLHGTALSAEDLHALLSAYPNVAAHTCGHSHQPNVWDRGGYLEIETGSIIDVPQSGRIIEIWRRDAEIAVRYASFSHLYTGRAFRDLPPAAIPADPFLPLRQHAYDLAAQQVIGGYQPKCGCTD
jgi:3',5'-cyclic AMP phosphodiesterase CpdA